MKRDVSFIAPTELPKPRMTIIQTTSGAKWVSQTRRVIEELDPGKCLESRRAADDLNDLFRDRGLTDAVHVERECIDQLAGVL